MKLVFGLGNPGEKYTQTRHNAGFMFVESLSEFLGWDGFYDVSDWISDQSFEAEICTARGGESRRVLLAKPLTFMNNSGRSARKLIAMHKININADFILVHDDLDIELGKFKIQAGVSPKVHNGVKSVDGVLGDRNYLRIRLGVDSRKGDRTIPGEDYVLRKMTEEELIVMKETIGEAVRSLRTITGI